MMAQRPNFYTNQASARYGTLGCSGMAESAYTVQGIRIGGGGGENEGAESSFLSSRAV